MDGLSSNTCRICLNKCTELDLDFKQFSKIYTRCTSYQLNQLDLPKKICSACTTRLISTSNFLKLCQRTEIQLLRIRLQVDLHCEKNNSEYLVDELQEGLDEELIEEYLDEEDIPTDETFPKKIVEETVDEEYLEPELTEIEDVVESTADAVEKFPLVDHSQSSFRKEDYLNLPLNQDDETYEEPIWLTCDLCNKARFKSLKRISELNHHVRNDHDETEALIRCDLCSRIFSAKCLFELHIKEKTCIDKSAPIERYYCTFCYTQNIRPDSIRKHLKASHPNQSRLMCSCNKRFNCLDELRLHHVKHQQCQKATAQLHKFLRCDFCSFTCRLESVMMYHCTKMHANESRYPCACGKVLYCSRDLQLQSNLYRCTSKNPCNQTTDSGNYEEKRSGRKADVTPETKNMSADQRKRYKYKLKCQQEVKCPHCDHKTSYYNIKRHIQSVHLGVQYICDTCNTVFAQKSSLKQHQEKKHLGIQRSFVCDECKKAFSNWSTRYYHILRNHRKRLRHECRYCQKQFLHRADLEDHVAGKHDGEKRVVCDKCNEKFYTKKSLDWHQRSVHETKPAIPCSYCEKSFVSKSHAKRHETQHCRGKSD